MPIGKVSVNAKPVILLKMPLLLVIVIVNVDVPFTAMVLGAKAFVVAGAVAIAAGAVNALTSNRTAAASSRFMVSTLPVSGGERGRR